MIRMKLKDAWKRIINTRQDQENYEERRNS